MCTECNLRNSEFGGLCNVCDCVDYLNDGNRRKDEMTNGEIRAYTEEEKKLLKQYIKEAESCAIKHGYIKVKNKWVKNQTIIFHKDEKSIIKDYKKCWTWDHEKQKWKEMKECKH